MSQRFAHLCFALAGTLVLLAGCASPQQRIDDNLQVFNQLPPEQQELIKQGKVGVGFDEIAVKLALGEPDRISERTDVHGKSITWRYVEYETDGGAPLYSGLYHYGYRGYGFAPFYYPYYSDYGSRQERDQVTVVFSEGKVSSVEEQVK